MISAKNFRLSMYDFIIQRVQKVSGFLSCLTKENESDKVSQIVRYF